MPRPAAAVLTALALALAFAGRAPAPAGPPAAPAADFVRDVRPALDAHCVKCHGPKKRKGGVDLAAFADEKSARKQRKLWRAVARQVEALEMPPAGEKPLAAGERELLVRWARQTADAVDCTDPADRDPGRAVVRRLSRAEYERTLRDLLGVPFDAESVGLPDDAPERGFANLAAALTLNPAQMDKYFAAADKALDAAFAPAADPKKGRPALDRLLVARPGQGVTDRDAARKVLARFARRAYRRPAADAEVDRFVKLYDRAAARGLPFEGAVRVALKAVLVSPNFLLRVEQDRAPAGSDAPYRVGDHELAVRLSYFLWSTTPDDTLAALADSGKLSDPATLDAQVKRMLADPKARALTDEFGAQWLQLKKLADARPSTEFFPTFTHELRQAMRDEALTFFDRLRAEDRSVLELLDTDYAYVNPGLAKHYGLPDVKGPELRRVALRPGDHRGGLLGMGAVLAMTSAAARTSPTLRGKYILEVVFGTPPPPPPPDAGMLKEEAKKGEAPKTFRELMAQHAARPACASCHSRIDPLGYGLENYDAVGRWRGDLGGRPLDTAGRLPGGEKFDNPEQLKRVLVQHKDEFVRNLAERALTYALGRELQDSDECSVRDVKAAMEKDGYRFSALVRGVVRSYPFQHRKNTDAGE